MPAPWHGAGVEVVDRGMVAKMLQAGKLFRGWMYGVYTFVEELAPYKKACSAWKQ